MRTTFALLALIALTGVSADLSVSTAGAVHQASGTLFDNRQVEACTGIFEYATGPKGATTVSGSRPMQQGDSCVYKVPGGGHKQSYCHLVGTPPEEAVLVCGGPISKTGFYFVLGCYTMMLFGIAYVGLMQQEADVAADADSEYASHFLGNKSFGWFLGFMTLFSTIYSGYTINGVPTEAVGLGFYSVRWLTSVCMVLIAALVFIPRIRRISVVRKYTSPNDLVTDRFNCRLLTLFNLFFLSANNIIYMIAQLYTLYNVLNVVTDGVVDGEGATWGFAIMILACEFMGGFRAVAYSDAIQTTIMIFAMVAIACVFEDKYGGLAGFSEDDCSNPHRHFEYAPNDVEEDDGTMTYGLSKVVYGCLYDVSAMKTSYPVVSETKGPFVSMHFNMMPLRILDFNILFFAFVLNPHWTTRIMSARSDAAVKKMEMVFSFVGLLVTLPGLIEGIGTSANYADARGGVAGFGVIVNHLMVGNNFENVIGIFACCASTAAIMSTTDSACLTISNMVTQDVLRNGVAPNIPQKNVAMVARIISTCSMILAVCIALYLPDLHDPATAGTIYGDLINFQNLLLWQTVPSHFTAIYFKNTTPGALCLGIIFGFTAGMCMVYEIFRSAPGTPANERYGVGGPDEKGELYFHPGIWGGVINIGVVSIISILTGVTGMSFPFGPSFGDSTLSQYGSDRLTGAKVSEIMSTTVEPLFTPIGAIGGFIMVLSVNICLPWYGEDVAGEFNSDMTWVNGLPQWFVGCVTGYLIGCFCNLICWSQWQTCDDESWGGSLVGSLQQGGEPVKADKVEGELEKEDFAV